MPTNTTPTVVIRSEDKRQMIQEAAYYRYVQRGYADGHDLDDWLAAEAQFAAENPGEEPEPQSASPAETMPPGGSGAAADSQAEEDSTFSAEEDDEFADLPIHQSGARGARADEALKWMVRHHPQRNIPNVEGIDAEGAPFKE